MRLKNILTCIAIAGAVTLAAGPASAIPISDLPVIRLDISGTMVFQGNWKTNNGVTHQTAGRVKVNTKSLIELLNNSTNFQTTLADMQMPTQIPAGSYFVWSLSRASYDGSTVRNYLTVTNQNGFSFNLVGYDTNTSSYYDYGFIDIKQEELFALRFVQTNSTGAGFEKDITGDEFYFTDGNTNYFDSYGNATLKWTFGKVKNGVQKTTLEADLSAPEGYYGAFADSPGMTLANLTVTGSGKSEAEYFVFPFYLWWGNPT
ncbi:MAG TPA: hypothetical protein VFV81_09735 [Verrucomicrobiae bacterium]|nr:hypothetical protein [Verrucomicrobiae bacterium]